jgi:DinB superfamily
MSLSALASAVEQFTKSVTAWPDAVLERDWKWRAHDEGIRFAFFRTYQELREFATTVIMHRARQGPPITTAQRILGQHHVAYRELQGILAGVRDDELDREPAPNEWHLRRVLSHLSRTEGNFTMQIQYALERAQQWDDLPAEMTEEHYDHLLTLSPFDSMQPDQGTLAEILGRFERLHRYVLEHFADLSDDELLLPSVWWEGYDVEIRFRMHRYDAHIRQHTIQVEKTLDGIGHRPTEVERLLRQVYNALGEAESGLIGALDTLADQQRDLAAQITARAQEITAAAT